MPRHFSFLQHVKVLLVDPLESLLPGFPVSCVYTSCHMGQLMGKDLYRVLNGQLRTDLYQRHLIFICREGRYAIYYAAFVVPQFFRPYHIALCLRV